MLIKTVEPSPNASTSFELDENDLVKALFKDLGRNIRHSEFNYGKLMSGVWYAFKDCRKRNGFDLPGRTILKDRDAKPLIEELNKIPGFERFSRKSRVETEMVKGSEIVFVDGQPVVFKREGLFIPVLTNVAALEKLPRITVDMGAVPHVVGGADIMAPGIRRVEGAFVEQQLVGVVDEKHGKFLAVGRSLLTSETLLAIKKGKVVTNIHYVGDSVWEAIKSQTPSHSQS